MVFSWTRHVLSCRELAPRPVALPGSIAGLNRKPLPLRLSLRWTRNVDKDDRRFSVQDILSKCLGQSVEAVKYGDAVVLRSRETIPKYQIVTFLDPRHATRIGLTPDTTVDYLANPCNGTCALRNGSLRVNLTMCEYLQWGGGAFVTCDTIFNSVRIVEVRCVRGAVVEVLGFNDEVISVGPLIYLWSKRDIPAGFNLVADCFEYVNGDQFSDCTEIGAEPEPIESTDHKPLPSPSPYPSTPHHPTERLPPSKKRKVCGDKSSFEPPILSVSHETRNACASVRKWVLTEYSQVWYEWPRFPLETTHVCQRGVVSQALKRTYALQFSTDRFRSVNPITETAALIHRVRTLHPSTRLRSSPGHSLRWPPHLHLYQLQELNATGNCDVIVSMDISSAQLQEVLPVQDTNWNAMIADNFINLVTFTGSLPVITSNEPATCEFIIVVVSGSAIACWTTNELYQKLLAEQAYA